MSECHGEAGWLADRGDGAMKAKLTAVAAAFLLSGCGGQEQPTDNGSEQVPAALNPGEYEITTLVENIRSTDNTTPATKAKAAQPGDKPLTHRACVASDGTVEPVMFSEAGDECRIDNAYTRNGRLTMQLACTRPGAPGQVMQSVNGNFTADSFDASVSTATYLTGAGDYAMVRKLAGKRVGDCAAAGDKTAA
jgi:hypothetical protein